MLADDFTPQQICVYLKVCTDDKKSSYAPVSGGDIGKFFFPTLIYLFRLIGETVGFLLLLQVPLFRFAETNEIPDYTYNGYPMQSSEVEYAATPNCMLCEEIIKEIEKNIHNKKSKVFLSAFSLAFGKNKTKNHSTGRYQTSS